MTDVVAIWQVERQIAYLYPTWGASARREATLETLRCLMQDGQILIGDIFQDGFRPWVLQGDAAVREVATLWTDERELKVGDALWNVWIAGRDLHYRPAGALRR